MTRTKPELGFWGRVRKSMAIRASTKSANDIIEQRLEIHEEPAAGDVRQTTHMFSSNIPITSEDNVELLGDLATVSSEDNSELLGDRETISSEENIELVGDRATTRKDTSSS